jgi:hypothetical protein
MEESIQGIDESVSLVNEIIDSILSAFALGKDPSIMAEKMSLLFDDISHGFLWWKYENVK